MKLYILKLEKQKYYIGKTKNIKTRITNHFEQNGSEWTKIYKPISVIKIISSCDEFDEDKYTKIYMRKYGIDNVRGGSYVKIVLHDFQYKALNIELRSSNDQCFKCGSKGHFVNQCFSNSDNNTNIKRPCIGCKSWDHKPNNCDVLHNTNVCYRCGKEDHWKITCIEHTDINGYELKSHPIGYIGNMIKNLW